MSKSKDTFDFQSAVDALRSGQDLGGENGVLTPLIKKLTEAAMTAEIEEHLSQEEEPNRKNGYSKKTIKTSQGSFELEAPRDRSGTYDPKLIKKNQTHLTDELERKILSMYGSGMSYQDIRSHIQEMYDMDVSNGTLSAITDKLLPEIKAWQSRPLESLYPIVWLDAIHFKVKDNGRFVSKAVYTLLGVNPEGRKELLGLYLSESEGG